MLSDGFFRGAETEDDSDREEDRGRRVEYFSVYGIYDVRNDESRSREHDLNLEIALVEPAEVRRKRRHVEEHESERQAAHHQAFSLAEESERQRDDEYQNKRDNREYKEQDKTLHECDFGGVERNIFRHARQRQQQQRQVRRFERRLSMSDRL